jgi:hypothetical protein
VDSALTQLENLYLKIEDPFNAEQIRQLKQKANTEGLTIREINKLARDYGNEFKQKAFSKNGEPLTSVTAQGVENTRSGLKDTARNLFGDDVFNRVDDELSSLINLRKTSDKMQKKVETLKNRIKERSLGEKLGRLIFKATDLLTLGTVGGFTRAILPRGQGLKVMNALDLEATLQKNLQQLDNVLKIQDKGKLENELRKIINQSQALPVNQLKTASAANTAKNVVIPTQSNTLPKKSSGVINTITEKIKNTPNKQGGFIKLPQGKADDLVTEAKKYKSADDFVKAQTDPLFEFKTGAGIKDPDIARGTVKEAISDIGGLRNVHRGVIDKNKLEVTENINTSSERYKQVLAEVKKGERTPIIANEYGEVIDGHHRLKAYEEIGLNEVPVIAPKDFSIKISTKSQLEEIWSKANKPNSTLPQSKVNESVSLPNNTTDLIKEAKKYKSAEEFVNKVENSTTGIGSVGKIADSFDYKTIDIKPVGDMNLAKFSLGSDAKYFKRAEGFGDLAKIMKDKNNNIFVYLNDGVDPNKLNKKTLANFTNSYEPWNKSASKRFITNDNGKSWQEVSAFELGSATSGMTKSQLTDIWNKANKK